jgi:hypothetical protein
MGRILLEPENWQKYAVVDEEDLERLAGYAWYVKHNGGRLWYAFRWLTRHYGAFRYCLHEEVMRVKSSRERVVDHINGDTLDNRRCNLRICSWQENRWNSGPDSGKISSKYKGITYRRRYASRGRYYESHRPWRVRVVLDRKAVFEANFCDEFEAYQKSQEVMKKIHGEFAFLEPWSGYSNPEHPNMPMNYVESCRP